MKNKKIISLKRKIRKYREYIENENPLMERCIKSYKEGLADLEREFYEVEKNEKARSNKKNKTKTSTDKKGKALVSPIARGSTNNKGIRMAKTRPRKQFSRHKMDRSPAHR